MKNTLHYLIFLLVIVPIYGQTIPPFYNGLDLTKTEDELFLELSTRLIDTHSAIPYTSSSPDVWDACKEADEDPEISTNVLLIYGFDDNDGVDDTDRSRNKSLQDSGGGSSGVWNREHVFAKSLAVPSFGTSEPGPGTDVHNLRPADASRNSTRSNKLFAEGSGEDSYTTSNGGWYPGDEWKGDVARIVMYMYLRYNGDGSKVSETKCLPINIGKGVALSIDSNMIDLFLNWNVADPVSDFESNRNDVLESYQGNRNPFVDNPYLATLIWGGDNAEDRWELVNPSDTEPPTVPEDLLVSNITHESFDLNWTASTDNNIVIDYFIYLNGAYLKSSNTNSASILNLEASTSYDISIKARDGSNNLSNAAEVSVTTEKSPNYLIKEDFENCSLMVFTPYNEASNKDWVCETQYGIENSNSMRMNGFTEDVASKDWLITTNPIDFDTETDEQLSFYTYAKYGSSPLELVYSSTYDGNGNPADFTWSQVPNISIPIYSDENSNPETNTFTNVDISAITGTVYIAFKYYSNGSPTLWAVDEFEIIADDLSPDRDGDGVLNENDLCPDTPAGETVDVNGCSNGQLDDDNDGVQNSDDLCADTPTGEEVNASGCSESQLDDDEDGVMNNVDKCPDTPDGEDVDTDGCSNGQLDDDNDGIQNSDDLCADTPAGEDVNAAGCAESQLDDDEDGVMNDVDQCDNTPLGETVDVNGCSESQLDDDNDGVFNSKDQCPNTTAGALVDETGCFKLASNNFEIEIVSETCADKGNGQIIIKATNSSYAYTAVINENTYNFNDEETILNLKDGIYNFCISVDNESYEQCYEVEIEAGGEIEGKVSVKTKTAEIEILKGTAPFNVLVNGEEKFKSNEAIFSIDVNHGDLVEVNSAIQCEGKFSKQVDLFDEIVAYPNPTKGMVQFTLPISEKEVEIELYNMQSQLIVSKVNVVKYGKVNLNLEELPSGVYFAKILLSTPVILKVVKE